MLTKKQLKEIYEKEQYVYGFSGTKIYKLAPKYYLDQDKDIFEDLYEKPKQAKKAMIDNALATVEYLERKHGDDIAKTLEIHSRMSTINCNEYKYQWDAEKWHIEADELLIWVLRQEGYKELCDWFEEHEKWYS